MIAIRRSTWSSSKDGFKRLTVRGRLAIILALSACVIGILTFQETRKTELQQSARSEELRKLAMGQIRSTDANFILSNNEFFGDPDLFDQIRQTNELDNTLIVGIERMSGLEHTIFGNAVEYKQFISALEELSNQIETTKR